MDKIAEIAGKAVPALAYGLCAGFTMVFGFWGVWDVIVGNLRPLALLFAIPITITGGLSFFAIPRRKHLNGE